VAPRQIVNHRRQPHQDRDPRLRRHRILRKVPDCSGTSLFTALIGFMTGLLSDDAFATFLFTLGPLRISGARKPACNANSASALPDGKRQLIGSIHSIGSVDMPTDTFLRPAPLFRALEPSGFIADVTPTTTSAASVVFISLPGPKARSP
jgi:hypothetical protein